MMTVSRCASRRSGPGHVAGFLAVLLAAPTFGQNAGGTAGSIQRAEQLIRQVAQAYKDAPALTDDYAFAYKSARGGTVNDQMKVALSAGADAEIHMEGFVVTAVNGWFYINRQSLPGKYFARPLQGNVIETFRDMTGGGTLPVPGAIFRYSDRYEDYVQAFGMARVQNLKVAGHEQIQQDGRTMDRIAFTADNGTSVTAVINPETRFVVGLQINDGMGVGNVTLSPRRTERLAQPITFDPSGRRQVESLADLRLGQGDPAPDFTLETLDGDEVTLSEQRGSVVVLDFWATWCAPCRWGLPKLQAFADWAQQSGHPVRVWAVDIGERQPTRQAIYKLVSDFWKSQKFTMSTLMDYDNAAAMAFEVGPIPHTVVIGPNGKVLAVHTGLDPNMLETLKKQTIKAFEEGSG